MPRKDSRENEVSDLVFCVENSQVKLQRITFCGQPTKGPHIFGVNNLMYYEGTAKICPKCIIAIFRILKKHKDKYTP